jgi:hypothetical protein
MFIQNDGKSALGYCKTTIVLKKHNGYLFNNFLFIH